MYYFRWWLRRNNPVRKVGVFSNNGQSQLFGILPDLTITPFIINIPNMLEPIIVPELNFKREIEIY